MNKINNNIEEPVCSPEVSKILKEKEFAVNTKANDWILAKDHTENYKNNLPVDESKVFYAKDSYELSLKTHISEEKEHQVYHVRRRPTHSIAAEWIRVNFGIHIQTEYSSLLNKYSFYTYKNDDDRIAYQLEIIQKNPEEFIIYNSSKEATEAALLYTLQNLIK